ncbi:hypothetical protein [Marivita sp.]
MADRAAFWVNNCLICDSPAEALSIDIHSAYSIGWLGQNLS